MTVEDWGLRPMTRQRPKIGLVARMDDGGLGMQTHDFYRHMKPDKTLVVDISHLTGYETYPERYPDAQFAMGFEISTASIDAFLEGLDIVFTVECPYNHYLYQKAREMGVKTVCQYNWEWLAHHQEPHLPLPDLFLAPSQWNIKEMSRFGVPVKYLHVPIDRQLFPFKKRKLAKKFLHIAGHRTSGDRNGTEIVLEALPYIQSDVEIVIRTQDDLPRPYTDSKLTIIKEDVANQADLFNDEDVLLLPRRYGGLSLQLNEAMSCGMVPVMLDIDPQNKLLSKKLLIDGYVQESLMIKTPVTVYGCTPQALAAKIDELANTDISYYSKRSDIYAKERDWGVMASQYHKIFEELCY